METDKTIQIARRVLDIEAEAVAGLSERLGDEFTRAVEIILSATGKVIVTGIGKSGIICKKIASTLSSTGTPAFFLHPSEGVHGDIGMLMRNDVIIAVSNSGETDELVKILPIVKRMGIKMIAMTGDIKSTLARAGDVALDVGISEEACPLGLAPTASTTACLAMGDAIAVALLERRGFQKEDFALLHPAGTLGRGLLKVADLMHKGEEIPLVRMDANMKDAILEMTAKRLGITGVVDESRRLVGIITDGDLRRALEVKGNILDSTIADVMTRRPKVIGNDLLAEAAMKKMEEHSITALFITDTAIPDSSVQKGEVGGEVVGIIHLHDLLKAGVV